MSHLIWIYSVCKFSYCCVWHFTLFFFVKVTFLGKLHLVLLISPQKHDLWVLIKSASLSWQGASEDYPHVVFNGEQTKIFFNYHLILFLPGTNKIINCL